MVLLAFAIEVVSHFPVSPGGQLGTLAKKVFGYSVADFVPNDPKLSEKPPLKGLFERRDKARKAAVTEELDPEAQRARGRSPRSMRNWRRGRTSRQISG